MKTVQCSGQAHGRFCWRLLEISGKRISAQLCLGRGSSTETSRTKILLCNNREACSQRPWIRISKSCMERSDEHLNIWFKIASKLFIARDTPNKLHHFTSHYRKSWKQDRDNIPMCFLKQLHLQFSQTTTHSFTAFVCCTTSVRLELSSITHRLLLLTWIQYLLR